TNGYLLTVNGAGDTNIQGPQAIISGAGGLNKQDDGTLTLWNANSYSGGTTIAGGLLATRADGALGPAGTSTTIQAGATLELFGDYTTSETLQVNGTGFGNVGAVECLGDFVGAIILQSASTLSTFNSVLTGGINNAGFPLTVAVADNTTTTIRGL